MEPGSAAPESTSLDDLECLVLEFLRGKSKAATVNELRESIAAKRRACNDLYPEPPPIDPSEGRHSTAEVERLLELLEGARPKLPQLRTRAGYVLGPKGFRAGEPGVEPAFVAALEARNLRDKFPDLWAVDALLWDKLESSPPKELACLWLESPGRRLVQDLSVLGRMPAGGQLGATDFSPERIDAAAGLDRINPAPPPPSFRAHHELYLAIAGGSYLDAWEPRPLPELRTEQIQRALNLLEEGSPLGLRGAALGWLLDEAVKKPHYEVDGVRRDLREDLTMRLSTALSTWLSSTNEAPVSRRLETLALHHAARFIGTDTSEGAVKRAWAIARWLQACLWRSPFFGGDEEVLAAHLEARLSESTRAALPENADALHPLRFSTTDDGLNVAEVAFISGLVVHYQQPREKQLLPTPLPLVHALQRLADRAVRNAEVAADQARLAGHNALGWPDKYPLMIPIAARKLMSDLRIGWLDTIKQDAQLDTLRRFQADPSTYQWVAFAIQREGKHLFAEARTFAAQTFRALTGNASIIPHVLGTFAAGIVDELSEDELKIALDIADQSEPPWGPFVMDAVAGALDPVKKNDLWTLVIEKLIHYLEDAKASDKFRLNAALFAMRNISASTAPNRTELHKRVAMNAGQAPFSMHAGLQAEFRRLGLAKPNVAGSKR